MTKARRILNEIVAQKIAAKGWTVVISKRHPGGVAIVRKSK